MIEVRKRPQQCAGCGKVNDDFSGPAEPVPGDISICIKCGYISIICDDYMLRDLTDNEAATLKGDARIITMIEKIKKACANG